tara:strand:- start:473 stop:916 length:444 start_codon:yes stop_codon:yes gene_type:complete
MEKKKSTFVNPIDPDKITENPGSLPYAHTVGGAVIKPNKSGLIRSKSLTAMDQQTDMQLSQIKEQIDLLAKQAKIIQDRKLISEKIYSAHIGFKPEINHIYHVYEREDGQTVLSMIGPDEWASKPKYKSYLKTVRLLADLTWAIEEN